MSLFSALKELAFGLKTGTGYALADRKGYVEKVVNPALATRDPGH